jgi:DNA invertase Pin-like site-specific DNA recombinase
MEACWLPVQLTGKSGSVAWSTMYCFISSGDNSAKVIQIKECLAFAEDKGYQLVPELCIQETGSGVKINPGLQEIGDAAQSRRFNVLVVSDANRIARNRELFETVLAELTVLRIALDSIHGNIADV